MVASSQEDLIVREKELSITFKRELLTLKDMGLFSGWAINALTARRRRVIKFNAMGMRVFFIE